MATSKINNLGIKKQMLDALNVSIAAKSSYMVLFDSIFDLSFHPIGVNAVRGSGSNTFVLSEPIQHSNGKWQITIFNCDAEARTCTLQLNVYYAKS